MNRKKEDLTTECVSRKKNDKKRWCIKEVKYRYMKREKTKKSGPYSKRRIEKFDVDVQGRV